MNSTIFGKGRGFDPNAVSADQMGLAIMQERAIQTGVVLRPDNRPGQGTELAFLWPANLEEAQNGC